MQKDLLLFVCVWNGGGNGQNGVDILYGMFCFLWNVGYNIFCVEICLDWISPKKTDKSGHFFLRSKAKVLLCKNKLFICLHM